MSQSNNLTFFIKIFADPSAILQIFKPRLPLSIYLLILNLLNIFFD